MGLFDRWRKRRTAQELRQKLADHAYQRSQIEKKREKGRGWSQFGGTTSGTDFRPTRLAVVVNLEWEGTLGDYLYYVLQTNGVSIDGTEVRYVNNAPDSLSRDMTLEHRSLADSAAGEAASRFLTVIKAVSPTGMHSRIHLYGNSLR